MSKTVYDVFISYSRKDIKVAQEICAALTDAGLTYFIDQKGIEAGQNFPQVLAEAIDDSTVFLFLASQNSFQSKFTRGEVTYAFNHKHSGTIIPYIIDGSDVMPGDLELMLGNFNWRRIEQYPIGAPLIEDIRKAIANPEEGTVGGRVVASQKKKKVMLWTAISVIALLLVAVAILSLSGNKDKQITNTAIAEAASYEGIISSADSLIRQADLLKDGPNFIETTDTQTTYLKQAAAALDSSDRLKQRFVGSEHIGMFNKDERVAQLRNTINSKLDSMFNAWKGYAMDSYNLFKVTHSKSEAQNAVQCIDHALFIKPDAELETLKTNLDQQ